MAGKHRAPRHRPTSRTLGVASVVLCLVVAGGVLGLQVLLTPDPPVAAAFSRAPRPVYTAEAAPPTTTLTATLTATAPTTTQPVPAPTTTLSAPVTAPAPARTAPPPPVYTSPLAPPSRKAKITPRPAPAAPSARPPVRPEPAPVVRAAPRAPAPPPVPAAPVVGAQGARIAAYARELAGTRPQIPYIWGGKTPAGFDCSGFIFYVFRHLGITDTYRDSGALVAWATTISANQARPGDIAYWPGHVAIFVGDGMMADAGNTRVDVSVRPLRAGASFARVPA